ncbi:DNA repair protein Sae2/CtIP, partial [Penicillium atrosanguineum]|uniref:DNA repair protein Sae2/CtIP n=1 Tax=Penicillium atrosanguineum TaxID=1132637 RepID=UPI00238DD426
VDNFGAPWNPLPATCHFVKRATLTDTMAGPSSHPIHVHPARPLYRFIATGLGASMWFFLMYRAKKDGPALLGWKHPWDH